MDLTRREALLTLAALLGTTVVAPRLFAATAAKSAKTPAFAAADLPLLDDWPQRPRQKVDRLQGKPSLTRFRVLRRDVAAGTTRLALQPLTGRTHQLRVHLLAIGHPIAGDTLYATGDAPTASRLMLHATRLELRHPATLQALVLTSAAPF